MPPRTAHLREIICIVRNVVKPLHCFALIVSVAALGCYAQVTTHPALPPLAQAAAPPQPVQVGVRLSPELARRVEVMIRSRSGVSPEYVISIGEPARGEIPGFDQIVVTFTSDGKSSKPVPFQLSTDGKTLAQFNTFDLSEDPKDKVSGVGRPSRGGPEGAPVLIVGFDDLECPYCAKMNALLFPAILERYKNQVRVVYRDFPLDDIHPWAMHAAVDANCLGAQSPVGYWNFVDNVHAHAAEMGGADNSVQTADQALDKLVFEEAARQKLNQQDVAACVLKQDNSKIKLSMKEAEGDPLGLDSAPVLFINGEKVEGVTSIENIYRIIDGALAAAGQTPPPPALPQATTKAGAN